MGTITTLSWSLRKKFSGGGHHPPGSRSGGCSLAGAPQAWRAPCSTFPAGGARTTREQAIGSMEPKSWDGAMLEEVRSQEGVSGIQGIAEGFSQGQCFHTGACAGVWGLARLP